MELEIDRHIQGMKDGNKVVRRRSLGKVYERFKDLEVRAHFFSWMETPPSRSLCAHFMDIDISTKRVAV